MERPIILVVEDHPTQQKVLALLADEYGFHAVVVSTCEAAEQALRENDVYSMIMMDLKLPDVDGITCAKRLRPLVKDGRKIPIIGMSGADRAKENCLGGGMDDFLPKPFTALEFRNMVRKWSKHSEGNVYQFPESDRSRDKYSG